MDPRPQKAREGKWRYTTSLRRLRPLRYGADCFDVFDQFTHDGGSAGGQPIPARAARRPRRGHILGSRMGTSSLERDWCTAFANEQQRCALGPGWCARTGGRQIEQRPHSPRSDAGGATQSSPRGAATRRRRLEAHPSPLCSPAPRPRWSTADLGGSAPRSRTTTTAQTHRDIITPPGPLERHELDSPASGPPAHADGRRLGHRDGQMGRPVPD